MKLEQLSKNLYVVKVETPKFIDQNKVVVTYLNEAKRGDRWFVNIFLKIKEKL